MTLQRYWTGSLGGIALEESPGGVPNKCLVRGYEALKSTYSGNSNIAADGRAVHTQIVQIDALGVAYSIEFEQMPSALYGTVWAALNSVIPSLGGVRAILTDGIDVLDVWGFPDVPNWFVRGEPSGAYVLGVTFNFLSVAGA
jgi:hypothetical protein